MSECIIGKNNEKLLEYKLKNLKIELPLDFLNEIKENILEFISMYIDINDISYNKCDPNTIFKEINHDLYTIIFTKIRGTWFNINILNKINMSNINFHLIW
jgi:hypothetical protein